MGDSAALLEIVNRELLLFSPNESRHVYGFNSRTGKELMTYAGHQSLVTSLAVDEWTLFTGSADMTVRVHGIKSGLNKAVLKGHQGRIVKIVPLAGQKLLTASWDNDCILWDLRKAYDLRPGESSAGTIIRRFKGHTNTINCMEMLDDVNFITGSADSKVMSWNLYSDSPVQEFETSKKQKFPILTLAHSKNFIFAGDHDASISVFQRGSGACVTVWRLRGDVLSMLVDEKTQRIVVAGNEPTIYEYDFDLKKPEKERYSQAASYDGHRTRVTSLKWYDDKRTQILSGSHDTTVRRWNRSSGVSEVTYKGPGVFEIERLAVTGHRVFATAASTAVRGWNKASGEVSLKLATEHHEPYTSLVLHPDGKTLLAPQGFNVAAYDKKTGKRLPKEKRFKGHSDIIRRMVRDEDTNFIYTSSRDASARVWDPVTYKELGVFHPGAWFHHRNGPKVEVISPITDLCTGLSYVNNAGNAHALAKLPEVKDPVPSGGTGGAGLAAFLTGGVPANPGSENASDAAGASSSSEAEDVTIPDEPAEAPAPPPLPPVVPQQQQEPAAPAASPPPPPMPGSVDRSPSPAPPGLATLGGQVPPPDAPAPPTGPRAVAIAEDVPAEYLAGKDPHDMLDGRFVGNLGRGLQILEEKLTEAVAKRSEEQHKVAPHKDVSVMMNRAKGYVYGSASGGHIATQKAKFLWTGEESGQIIKWDLEMMLPVRMTKIPDEVRCLEFDDIHDRLFVGTHSSRKKEVEKADSDTEEKGGLYVFNGTSGEMIYHIPDAHDLAVTDMELNKDHSKLFTSSYDRTWRQWDISSTTSRPVKLSSVDAGSPIHVLARYNSRGQKDRTLADHLLVGCTDGAIRMYNLLSLKLVFTFTGHRTPVESIRVEGDVMHSGSEDLFSHNLHLALRYKIVQQHDKSGKNGESGIARLTATYGNTGEFFFNALLLAVEVLQLLSFAFVTPIPWNSEVVEDFMGLWQNFLPLVIPADVALLGSALAILVFVAIFLTQERLEKAKFLKAGSESWSNLLQYAWIAVTTTVKLGARPAFLPLMRILITPLLNGGDLDDDGDVSCLILCFEGAQFVYIGISVAMMLLYLPTVTRLGLVLGELDNIEVKRNPFDWTEDRVEAKVGHPLSYNTAAAKYFGLSLFFKLILLVVTVLVGSDGDDSGQLYLVAYTLIIVGFLQVPVTYWYPPFWSDRACAIRSALDIGITLSYVTSLVALLVEESGDLDSTLALQLNYLSIPLMLITYWVYSKLSKRRRARADRLDATGEKVVLKPTYKAPELVHRNSGGPPVFFASKGASKGGYDSDGFSGMISKSAPMMDFEDDDMDYAPMSKGGKSKSKRMKKSRR